MKALLTMLPSNTRADSSPSAILEGEHGTPFVGGELSGPQLQSFQHQSQRRSASTSVGLATLLSTFAVLATLITCYKALHRRSASDNDARKLAGSEANEGGGDFELDTFGSCQHRTSSVVPRSSTPKYSGISAPQILEEPAVSSPWALNRFSEESDDGELHEVHPKAEDAQLSEFAEAQPSTLPGQSPVRAPSLKGTESSSPLAATVDPSRSEGPSFFPDVEAPVSLDTVYNLYYRIPSLVEGEVKGVCRCDVVLSTGSRNFSTKAFSRMQDLLGRQKLNTLQAEQLVVLGERTATVLARNNQPFVEVKDSTHITRDLALRYIQLDALVCVIQVLGPAMKASEWWDTVVERIASKYDGRATLAVSLSQALELLKRGKRPSVEATMRLKTRIFFGNDSIHYFKQRMWNPWRTGITEAQVRYLLNEDSSLFDVQPADENADDTLNSALSAFPLGTLPGPAPSLPLDTHVYYRLPVLEQGVIGKTFRTLLVLAETSTWDFSLKDVRSMLSLLAQPKLTPEEAEELVLVCEVVASHLVHENQSKVENLRAAAAARMLARRYLCLEGLFCAIQLLGPVMNADEWWEQVVSVVQTEYRWNSVEARLTPAVLLARRLSEALYWLKRGVRPPQPFTIALKTSLFRPEGIRSVVVDPSWDPLRTTYELRASEESSRTAEAQEDVTAQTGDSLQQQQSGHSRTRAKSKRGRQAACSGDAEPSAKLQKPEEIATNDSPEELSRSEDSSGSEDWSGDAEPPTKLQRPKEITTKDSPEERSPSEDTSGSED